MSFETPMPARDAAEVLLGSIRGVLAARVVRAPDASVAEVHLVGTPERSPKAIIRDAESLLYVRLSTRVDYRKISLVQVQETGFQTPPRVRLDSVVCTPEGQGMTVQVTLSVGSKVVQGAAYATSSQEQTLLEASALATLTTINQLPNLYLLPRLECIERHQLGRQDVCIVHLSLQSDEHSEDLLGIASLRAEPVVAASRATLDAVNRRLSSWLNTFPSA